jgi:hypothetical protein
MPTEKTELTGPVSITPDSEARVALELAQIIAANERTVEIKDREYWLNLYHQCRRAASSNRVYYNLDEITKPKNKEAGGSFSTSQAMW